MRNDKIYDNKRDLKFWIAFSSVFLGFIILVLWLVNFVTPDEIKWYQTIASNIALWIILLRLLRSIFKTYKRIRFEWPLLILKEDWLYDRYSFEIETRILGWDEIQVMLTKYSHKSAYLVLKLRYGRVDLVDLYKRPYRKGLVYYKNKSHKLIINQSFFRWGMARFKSRFEKFTKKTKAA